MLLLVKLLTKLSPITTIFRGARGSHRQPTIWCAQGWRVAGAKLAGPWRKNMFFGIRTGHSTIIYVTTG